MYGFSRPCYPKSNENDLKYQIFGKKIFYRFSGEILKKILLLIGKNWKDESTYQPSSPQPVNYWVAIYEKSLFSRLKYEKDHINQ